MEAEIRGKQRQISKIDEEEKEDADSTADNGSTSGYSDVDYLKWVSSQVNKQDRSEQEKHAQKKDMLSQNRAHPGGSKISGRKDSDSSSNSGTPFINYNASLILTLNIVVDIDVVDAGTLLSTEFHCCAPGTAKKTLYIPKTGEKKVNFPGNKVYAQKRPPTLRNCRVKLQIASV